MKLDTGKSDIFREIPLEISQETKAIDWRTLSYYQDIYLFINTSILLLIY